MSTFKELGVSNEILRAIEEMGYEHPMPVQEEVIPYLLGTGNDVVALAQTGTGKTAAFGLPLIQKVQVNDFNPQALILSPTREICIQIANDLADYSKYINGLRIIPMYGGTSIENQIRNFRRGAHIIVATPGRLIDLMERGVVKLDTVRDVVLDEADEMLNMGFSESLDAILAKVPEERNTLMFSATMSREIAAISKKYLRNAREIIVGTKNEGAKNVNHVYYMVQARDKYLALKRVVDYYPNIYGIIFCRTRLETQDIADKLMQDGYNAESLHGELSQAQRDLTMQKFRKRQLQLLVATDVAARGLDVDDLTHIINYGLPDDIENYTHRSGRTGRAGKTGTSIAIINLKEKGKVRFIEKSIGKQFITGEMPTGQQICEKQLLKVIDDIEKIEVNDELIGKFLPEIYRKMDWLDKEDIIKRIVSREFSRFLNYYNNAPDLTPSVAGKGDFSDRNNPRKAQSGYTRFFINIGKMDGISAGQIIELVNQNIKDQRIEIGRIDLMQSFSFFESPKENTDILISSLGRAQINGRKISVEVASDKDNRGEEKRRGSYKGNFSRSDKRDSQRSGDFRSGERKDSRDGQKSYSSNISRSPNKRSASKDGSGESGDWRQFFNSDNNSKGGDKKPKGDNRSFKKRR